jgi:hypothetical protein
MNSYSRRGRLAIAMVLALGAALAASALASAGTQAPPKQAALVVHHVVRGCHSWALNGGPIKVNQTIHLARGGFLTLTNNDLMAQELVQVKGPKVIERLLKPFGRSMVMKGDDMGAMAGKYTLNHTGARVKVTFPKSGVYNFKLVDRGDYMEVKTIGPDHKPKLTVVVS